MTTNFNNSKQSNGIRKIHRDHQAYRYQKPTKFIVTLKPRTVDVPGKVSTNYWSPRLKSHNIQRVLIEGYDVFGGNAMLDLNHSVKLHQLDHIEEHSECSKSNMDVQNHELRASHSLTDIRRLDGGCIEFKKKWKSKQRRLHESQISKEQSLKYHKNKFDRSDKAEINQQESDASLQKVCEDHMRCDRIEDLEQQIKQMYCELNDIRKQIVPPEDVDKFSAISEHLNEIYGILSQLKFNCMQLQQSDEERQEYESLPQNESKSPYKTKSGRHLQGRACPVHAAKESDCVIHSKESKRSKSYCCNIIDDTASNPRSKNECVNNFYFNTRLREDCLSPHKFTSDTNSLIHCSTQTTSSLLSGRTNLKQDPHIFHCGCDNIQISTPNEAFHCSSTSGVRKFQPQERSDYGSRKTGHNLPCQIKRFELQNCRCDCFKTFNYDNENVKKSRNCSTIHNKPQCAFDSGRYYKCDMDNGKLQSRSTEKKSPLLDPSSIIDCQTPVETCIFKKSESESCNILKHHYAFRKPAGNNNRQEILELSSAYEKTSSSCMPTNSADTASSSYNHVLPPIVRDNLMPTILDIINTIDHTNIALTVMLTRQNLYHINISVTHTGQSLGDIYATVKALRQAEREHLFDNFLTFFVLTSNSHLDEENTIFGHSYEFIKTDSCQRNIFTDSSHHSQYGKHRRRPNRKKSMKDRTASRDSHRTFHLHGNTCQDKPRELPKESMNFSYNNKKRLKGGSSNEGIDKSKQLQESLSATEQLLKRPETTNQRNVVEARDDRLEYLEQQVDNLRLELNHIREALVPQEDVIKFSYLSDRLKELNALLKDLRDNYHKEQIEKNKSSNKKPPLANIVTKEDDNRERNRLDVLRKGSDNLIELKSDKHIINREDRDVYTKVYNYVNGKQNESNELQPSSSLGLQTKDASNNDYLQKNYAPSTSAECQKFLDEIKNPKNLFERHLLMMKDFRTDADLRRQRLERKRREQLLQRQGNKSSLSHNHNDVKITQDKVNEERVVRSEHDVIAKSLTAKGTTEASKYQLDTEIDKSKHFNWNSLRLPQVQVPIETETSATQTDEYLNKTCMPELSQSKNTYNYHETDAVSSESVTIAVHSSKTSSTDLRGNGLNSSLHKPIIESNLCTAIHDILNSLNLDHTTVILTIVLESDQLYHINITTTSSGQSLGYLYATEEAIQEAQDQGTFSSFLIFFVVNAKNSLEQKHRLLGHSFEIMKPRK